MKIAAGFMIVLILSFAAAPLAAQNQEPAPNQANDVLDQQETQERQRRSLDRLGLIFNTQSILLELEQYQDAGIGMKVFWDRLALRGVLGLRLASGNHPFAMNLGSAVEYHLSPGTVSPYFGGGLLLAFERYEDTMVDRVFELALGPLLGVEIAPLPMLSFFAEYVLNFTAAYARSNTPGGTDATWNYKLATDLGNQGRIGIVIYLLDRRPADDPEADG